MSDLPVASNYFVGGQRVSPIDSSEGGSNLASLLNAAGQNSEAAAALTASVDLSGATAAEVKAASRKLSTNAGAARAYTLPVFASAPDGWEHTFISIDGAANTFTVTHAGTDTINGVAGNVALATNHSWCKVFKVPGASGWYGVGGTMVTPA